MDFLKDFGVQPVLIAAQIVNFLILLFLLKKFLYKPILKVLDERKQKIVDSLKNAEEIEKRLEQITKEREKRLAEASQEAKKALEEASKTAELIVFEAHQKATKETERLLEKAKQSIRLEKDQLRQEMRSEFADMVVLGLQKVTGKVLTAKDQKELLKKSLEDLR